MKFEDTLRYENKEYVLKNLIPYIDKDSTTPKELAEYNQYVDDATKVTFILIATMAPELQKTYDDYWPYDVNLALSNMFLKRIEKIYEVVKAFMARKLKDRQSVCSCAENAATHGEIEKYQCEL